jgi:hypothetical protein
MRTLRLATVAAVCALGTVICLVAGAVAMGPGVRDLIPQTGRPGRDWIGRGSGRRVVLRWAWWSSWSGFWDRCTGGFLRHPSSGRPVMILAPVLGAVGLTLVTVSHLIPIAIGYELVPAVRDGAASVAQVIWAFGFSSRHRSRRSRLGWSSVATTISGPATTRAIPHHLRNRRNGPGSSAITPPAMVTQPHERKLEAVYGVWRMRRDVATAARRRPRLSV